MRKSEETYSLFNDKTPKPKPQYSWLRVHGTSPGGSGKQRTSPGVSSATSFFLEFPLIQRSTIKKSANSQ
jgi:hypothetical protein